MAATRGGSLADLRTLNASTVFELIRAKAPISRAQISREVGLTRPTVSSALETLLEAGLVREAGRLAGQPHYGATFFETAPSAAYFVAFDIDRRQFRAILVDAAGSTVASLDAHRALGSPQDLVAQVVEVTDQLCTAAGVQRQLIALAVLGVPAAVDPSDGRLRLSAYRLLEGFALGPAVSHALGVPALVDNDVNLAALGEHAAGAAVGVRDFAYLTIGRNVGSGIVLRDEIRRGAHGAAGEVDAPVTDAGHLTASPAADAFEALAREVLASGVPGSETSGSEASGGGTSGGGTSGGETSGGEASGEQFQPTPAAVFAAAGRGHPLAEQILTEQARRIAEVIAVLGRVLDLSLVVLGGGIGRRCGPILTQIEREVAARLPFPPAVVISLVSQRPVLVGASTVGLQEALQLVTAERLGRVIRRSS